MKDCIRIADIKEYTGLSASSIWRLEYKGVFPKRRQLGGRAVGWLRCEVDEWLQSREKITVGSQSKLNREDATTESQSSSQPIILIQSYLLFNILKAMYPVL